MGFEERFRTLIGDRAAERGWQKVFAKTAGLQQSALSKIISGQTKDPGLESEGRIMDALGEDALACLPPTMHRLGANAPVEAVQGDGLPRVPVLGSAGAGEPHEFWSTEPVSMLEVLPQYAKPNLAALTVEGVAYIVWVNIGRMTGPHEPLEGIPAPR